MSYLMEIDNLGKRYDDFELSGVSLAVEPGCVVGFIGSNGAGKTTTIKAILGIIAADAGTVRLFGQPVTCGSAALDAGAELSKVAGLPVRERIGRAKYIPEENIKDFDKIESELSDQMSALTEGV